MRDLIDGLLNTTLGLGAPDWLVSLISYVAIVTIIFLVAPFQMLFFTMYERRAIARMQDRIGPNRVGPEGAFQPIADGVKMFTKEDIVPAGADRWVHLLAPCVVVAPTMLLFAVVPWGPGMVPVDLNVGLLFFVAISSVSAIGIMMAGWGSNNKFALLGAMRGVAQMISYEIPAVLSLLAAVLLAGSMSLVSLVNLQAGLPFVGMLAGIDLGLGWLIFTPVGFVGAICFFIAALAEGERTPFDIPEADSEIVAGYMTEYSGMKFGLFYLAQYILNFLLCAITATVFLGGWQFPGVNWLYERAISPANPAGNGLFNVLAGVLGVFAFLLKTYLLFYVMIWLRGAFPRLRVDQLMHFGWKFLIPLSLVNILSASLWVACMQWGAEQGMGAIEGWSPWARLALAFVLTFAINLVGYIALVRIQAPTRRRPSRLTGSIAVP